MSAAQARRIALAAQGFGRPRGAVGTRQLNLLLQRLAVLQLDSVNVFERSHYLPVFARLGAYDKSLLDTLTFRPRSPYIEYWAHMASLIPLTDWPLWGWRRRAYVERGANPASWSYGMEPMLDFLRAELREKGPLTAGQVEHHENRRNGPWWGWSEVKTGLEVLFMRGEVVAAGRRNFERSYDLAERRIPAGLLEREVAEDDAVRELVRISARALGVGTVRDIADYFRLLQAPATVAIRELVDAGELLPVTVDGWNRPAYLHPEARIPRRIETAALLSPFDPIVWERERTLRMFGFHYRIEIYTPAPKRIFGYYTLPVLVDDALVGRIDLKTDRQSGVLRVQSAWREKDAPAGVEARIAPLLRETAAWQAMERIEFAGRGDLSAGLEAELLST
ncbi:MAG: winged helix-turn-helix protein [Rhodoglobus sp.]|nr:winged helix-turn-helix protein [Rhodoglobus sp.]